MRIIERGMLAAGIAGTPRATLTFPMLLALPDGGLLATYRTGSTKDCADETIELRRSADGGRTWSAPITPFDEPHAGLKLCYLTQAAPDRLLAAAMWVDHAAYPGAPLFNPQTEGCLPMAILLAESPDAGHSWSAWRQITLPAELGPPSLTSPLVSLPDGTLVMSIESNKHYHDSNPWRQQVVLFHSADGGASWGSPYVAGADPAGQIFNWDQRLAVAHDGRIGAFVWTFNREANRYHNIHRRVSSDGGKHWSVAEDLGFADQPGRPTVLPDGGVVLPYVDRFGSCAIRIRYAPDLAAAFDPASDLVIYQHHSAAAGSADTTGAALADMGIWSFGLPFSLLLPDGDLLVAYYAGSGATLDIHWVRIRRDAGGVDENN
ncbi:MAG TPA: sialidase family protein [Roseiflexaceae bacterium]|nr:sialidase family protein [Roseiflexaceae bacterium]